MVSGELSGGGPSGQEDMVAPFQIEHQPVRGRVTRLGAASLDPILKRHAYPGHVARLIGEALLLATLVGSSLKFRGRLLVQAEGDGPIGMLVGEYATDGSLRAYARIDERRWADLERIDRGARPHIPQLFGPHGRLALIIVHDDPSMQPYQGIVPLQHGSLAECAEDYFARSEQVPTRIALTIAERERAGHEPDWLGGGMLIQQVAGDEARGETGEAWDTARALFATLRDQELADPCLTPADLLFRLFHEEGVRLEPAIPVRDSCSCNEERLRSTLSSFSDDALRELVDPDGTLDIRCQFCGRGYRIPVDDVTGQPH